MEKNIEQDYLAHKKTGQHNKEIEQKKNSCQGGGGDPGRRCLCCVGLEIYHCSRHK